MYVKEGINLWDINSLVNDSHSQQNPYISFMKSCSDINGRLYQCPARVRPLYQSLYKMIAPASALLPCCVWEAVASILHEKTIKEEDLDLFTHFSPTVSGLIMFIASKKGEQQEIGLSVLGCIFEKAKCCYITKTQTKDPVQDLHSFDQVDPRIEVAETGVYFPGRPMLRKIRKVQLQKDVEGGCNKDYYPGTLLYWCGEHRKCLGFYILPSHESLFQVIDLLKKVYSIFVTRFRRMPQIIIYDNGCNLSDYILNRSPLLFANTIVLSDGFHWKNHDNCTIAYNSNAYLSLKGFNSVLHEQMNRYLDKLKPIAIHMRMDSFSEILTYTLSEINYGR
jgi:hypothetical protein